LQADSLVGAIPTRSTNMNANTKRLKYCASHVQPTEFETPRVHQDPPPQLVTAAGRD